jgi:hypothetical protein
MYHPQPDLMKGYRGTGYLPGEVVKVWKPPVISKQEQEFSLKTPIGSVYLPGQVNKVWHPPIISKQEQEFSLKTPIPGGRRSKTSRRRL